MKESSSISRVVRSSRRNEVRGEAFCTHPFTDIVGNDGDVSEVKRFRRKSKQGRVGRVSQLKSRHKARIGREEKRGDRTHLHQSRP